MQNHQKYEIDHWITKNGVHIPILRQPVFKGHTAKETRNILKNSQKGDESHLAFENVKKMARINHIALDVSIKEPIDEDVLITQVQSLRDIADEFPQVEEFLKKHNQKLALKVEAFKASDKLGDHTSNVSSADTDPSTNVICLNSKSEQFKGTLEECVEASLKFGKKHKWGNGVLSTNELGHTAVHEFGHIMQNVLADKLGDSKSEVRGEILQIAMGKCGLKEKPRNISSYGNKNDSELISECIADAYFNGKNANKFSIEIYNYMKRKLGKKGVK